MGDKKILLGLTTWGSNWKEKVREIDRFDIKEAALFLTGLETEERKGLYDLLEKTCLEKILHVHLRASDMPLRELDYLAKRWGSEVFNIHSPREYPVNFDYSKYKNSIYLENTLYLPLEDELSQFAGLCLDFHHWENFVREKNDSYVKEIERLAKKYPIGCCHIATIKHEPKKDMKPFDEMLYATHWMEDLSEINYIKNYLEYIPNIVSIELQNPFEEQMKVKKYLEKIIKN